MNYLGIFNRGNAKSSEQAKTSQSAEHKFRCSISHSAINLVPRALSYLSLGSERERERERPWLGLVTCLQNKIHSEGGVLFLLIFCLI